MFANRIKCTVLAWDASEAMFALSFGIKMCFTIGRHQHNRPIGFFHRNSFINKQINFNYYHLIGLRFSCPDFVSHSPSIGTNIADRPINRQTTGAEMKWNANLNDIACVPFFRRWYSSFFLFHSIQSQTIATQVEWKRGPRKWWIMNWILTTNLLNINYELFLYGDGARCIDITSCKHQPPQSCLLFHFIHFNCFIFHFPFFGTEYVVYHSRSQCYKLKARIIQMFDHMAGNENSNSEAVYASINAPLLKTYGGMTQSLQNVTEQKRWKYSLTTNEWMSMATKYIYSSSLRIFEESSKIKSRSIAIFFSMKMFSHCEIILKCIQTPWIWMFTTCHPLTYLAIFQKHPVKLQNNGKKIRALCCMFFTRMFEVFSGFT